MTERKDIIPYMGKMTRPYSEVGQEWDRNLSHLFASSIHPYSKAFVLLKLGYPRVQFTYSTVEGEISREMCDRILSIHSAPKQTILWAVGTDRESQPIQILTFDREITFDQPLPLCALFKTVLYLSDGEGNPVSAQYEGEVISLKERKRFLNQQQVLWLTRQGPVLWVRNGQLSDAVVSKISVLG